MIPQLTERANGVVKERLLSWLMQAMRDRWLMAIQAQEFFETDAPLPSLMLRFGSPTLLEIDCCHKI